MPSSRASRVDVVKAIRLAGYPLEQRVAQVLENASFTPMPSWTWWDERREVERELDVAGERMLMSADLAVAVHVLAECKRFSNGIVMFESDLSDTPLLIGELLGEAHYWGQPAAVESDTGPGFGIGFPSVDVFRWFDAGWPMGEAVAYQYGVMQFRKNLPKDYHPWTLDNEEAHASIDGLCRALLSYREEFGVVAPGVTIPYLNFAALVVVVEGPLYVHRSPRPGKRASTRRVQRATYFRRGFTSKGERVAFRVDFIQESGFRKFVEGLRDTTASMLSTAEKLKARLERSVEAFGHTRVRST